MFSVGNYPCRWCEVMNESKNPQPPESDPVDLKDLTKSIQELRSTIRFWVALVLCVAVWGIVSVLFLAMHC
jgi:hypothetical protein